MDFNDKRCVYKRDWDELERCGWQARLCKSALRQRSPRASSFTKGKLIYCSTQSQRISVFFYLTHYIFPTEKYDADTNL